MTIVKNLVHSEISQILANVKDLNDIVLNKLDNIHYDVDIYGHEVHLASIDYTGSENMQYSFPSNKNLLFYNSPYAPDLNKSYKTINFSVFLTIYSEQIDVNSDILRIYKWEDFNKNIFIGYFDGTTILWRPLLQDQLDLKANQGASSNRPLPSALVNNSIWVDETGVYQTNTTSWNKISYTSIEIDRYFNSLENTNRVFVYPSLGRDPVSIASINRLSNIVTITTSADHNFSIGESIIISGFTPANLNGTFNIKQILTSTSFTYESIGSDTTATVTTQKVSLKNNGKEQIPFKTFLAALNSFTAGSPRVIVLKENIDVGNITFRSADQSLRITWVDKVIVQGTFNLVSGNTSIYFDGEHGQLNATINDASNGTVYYNSDCSNTIWNITSGGYKQLKGSLDFTSINLSGSATVQTFGTGAIALINQSNGILDLQHRGPAVCPILSGTPTLLIQEGVQLIKQTIVLAALSRYSNTVTATSFIPHNLNTGDKVTIAGATPVTFNGTFTITSVLSANAFTYTQSAANASVTTNPTATGEYSLRCTGQQGMVYLKGCSTRQMDGISFGKITFAGSAVSMCLTLYAHVDLDPTAANNIFPTLVFRANSAAYLDSGKFVNTSYTPADSSVLAHLNAIDTVINSKSSIDDVNSADTTTYSSSKINTELNKKAVIDDATASSTKTYSSSKINTELNKRVLFGTHANTPLPASVPTLSFWIDETGIYQNNGTIWVKQSYTKAEVEAYVAANGGSGGGGGGDLLTQTLTGFSQPSSSVVPALVSSSDTILQALNKLEKNVKIWSALTANAMISLTNARVGDVCIRLDTQPYILYRLDTAPYSIESNWSQIGGAGQAATPENLTIPLGTLANQKLINWTGGNPNSQNNLLAGTPTTYLNASVFDTVSNSVQLTSNALTTNGQIYWDFLQQNNRVNVDFSRRNFEAQFQFRTGNGGSPKGDGIYFYYLTNIIPTYGTQTGTGGYVICLNETNTRVEIYYDGTLLTSYGIANISNGSSHTVKIKFVNNVITINYDGADLILNYQDVYRPIDSGKYIGLGAWCATNYAQHYVSNFKITSLGTVNYFNVTTTEVYNKLKSVLAQSESILFDFNDSLEVLTIRENKYLKSINGQAPDINGNISITTDSLPEGDDNKYYSQSKVFNDLSNLIVAGDNVNVITSNNQIQISVPTVIQADLNSSTIKSRYESNADTNAFTNYYKSKLDNVPASIYTDNTFVKVQNETVYQPYIDIDLSLINFDNVIGFNIEADFETVTNNVSLQYSLIDLTNTQLTGSIYDWHNFYRYQSSSYGHDQIVNDTKGYISYRGIANTTVGYQSIFSLDVKYVANKYYFVSGEGQFLDYSNGYIITTGSTGTIKYTQKIKAIRIYASSGRIRGNFRLFTLTKTINTPVPTESLYIDTEVTEQSESLVNNSNIAKTLKPNNSYLTIPTNLIYDTNLIEFPPLVIYSMRLTRAAYVGPCLRIKRSSDNVEKDIYFNSDGSFDILSVLDFCPTSDASVCIWYDQSGNGNDFINSGYTYPKIIRSSIIQTISTNKYCVSFTTGENLMMKKNIFDSSYSNTNGYSILNRQLMNGTYRRTITSENGNTCYFTYGSRKSSTTDGVVQWDSSITNASGGEGANTALCNYAVAHSSKRLTSYRDGIRCANTYINFDKQTTPFKFSLNGYNVYMETSDVNHFEFILLSGMIQDADVVNWNNSF